MQKIIFNNLVSMVQNICNSTFDFLLGEETRIPLLEDTSLFESIHLHQNEIYKNTYACLPYQHPEVKKAILALKYQKNQVAADFLGFCMFETLKKIFPEDFKNKKFVLIPIPAHSERMSVQGFNQSLLLAEAIVKRAAHTFRDNCIVSPLLRYSQDTPTQKSLSRKERIISNYPRFIVESKSVCTFSPQTVAVIIDDVVTTGATCNDAMRACRECADKLAFEHIITITAAH